MPGIFIGNCLVKPEKATCLISIINITDEQVVIPTGNDKRVTQRRDTGHREETTGASNAA